LLDDVADVNALTWSHRGIANGFVLPASQLAMVSCYAVLSDDLAGGNRSLGKLTADEKVDALAYIIAQYLGVYLIDGRDRELSVTGGLARPFQLLTETRDFTDMRKMRIDKVPHATRGIRGSYTFKVLLRMEVGLARHDWPGVLQEANRAQDALFDTRQSAQVAARQRIAERNLWPDQQ
jgi:hypothetical protein